MNALCTLPTELLLRAVAGVASVATEEGRMIVRFRGGMTATVERCPLSQFSDRESFDLYLPSERPGFAAEIAPGLSAAAVVEMLNELAANAA